MSNADFRAVAKAFAGGARAPDPVGPEIARVTVLGGGAEGRALGALSLASGKQVAIFSAYGAELDAMRGAGAVTVRGSGPIGSYPLDADEGPTIRVTSRLDEATADADVIFVTGPVLKQRTYSMVLAEHLRDGQLLVLAGARTFGALEMAWYLQVGGCRADVTVVELQAFPYRLRVDRGTLHMHSAGTTCVAALPATRRGVLERLGELVPDLAPLACVLHTSFGDASGLVDTVALMLGGPSFGDQAPALPGFEPHPDRAVFRGLIGPRHAEMIAQLAEERREVARRFGVRDVVLDDEALLARFAGPAAGEDSRPVPDGETARQLIRCGAIGSLIPLASAARLAGVAVPATTALVRLAEIHLGGDLANAGRRLEQVIASDATDFGRLRREVERQVLGP